jgi:plasmid stabilization system protein ParE
MRSLIIQPDAESDLAEAYAWYELQRPGLGDDFLLRIESSLESLRVNPEMYPQIYQEVRRKIIRHFPFCIFYIVGQSSVSVIAVLHAKRHPKHWRKRIQ